MNATDRQVTICRKISFSSGHRYFQSRFSGEKNRAIFGSSYSPAGHGHNFVLEACFRGQIDPLTGMVINLKEIDQLLQEVVEPLDHHFLNHDVEDFKEVVPTTENIALYCYKQLEKRVGSLPVQIQLQQVRLVEGDDLRVECKNNRL